MSRYKLILWTGEDKRSLMPVCHFPPDKQETKLSPAWRTYLNNLPIILSLTAASLVAVSCCVSAVYVVAHASDWTTLYSFGGSMSLQSARYLNFALDMVVRALTVVASLLLNYVAIRIVTALSFKRAGVLAQDAIALNLTGIDFVPLWDAICLRVPKTLRVCLSMCLLSGLVSYFAGNLIFGYQALEATKVETREVQHWSYDIVLGSALVAPDYTGLVPSGKPVVISVS
ncbi:hypothetical protein FRC06_007808 [Ceratobasidium sp. 370]|nr:hypothetical protein FRC06_007808 [Ceratobasidium sp. 370]